MHRFQRELKRYFRLVFVVVGILLCGLVGFSQDVTRIDVMPPKRLPPEINSYAEEVKPLISREGNTLYFVRALHELNGGGQESYDQDIWISEKDAFGDWTEASNKFRTLNNDFNNAVVGFSTELSAIFLTNAYQNLDKVVPGIAFSRKKGDGWSEPELIEIPGLELVGDFNDFYINSRGNIIIISIMNEGGFGEEDLYVTFKRTGRWTEPLNLGPTLNTRGFEISPFLAFDRRTMYFSSNGHGGEGDADIFMTKRLDDTWTNWSEPENIGKPFNSEKFDAYFMITFNKEIFFASNREDVLSDLYYSKVVDPQQTPESFPHPEPEPELVRIEIQQLRAPNNYVFFDFDRDILSNAEMKKLDLAYNYLMQVSDLKVGLFGHTDFKGSDEYNKALSVRRVNACRDYLIKRGIDEDRIIRSIGLGEGNPIATNNTESGQARNRRTEIIFSW